MEEFKKTLEEIRKTIKEEIKKIKIERDYRRFGIEFNPFPPAAIARYPQLSPLDSRIKEKISLFIRSTYSQKEEKIGEYSGLAIVGEYGMGKTHLMKHIKLIIDTLSNDEEIQFKAITCFVDRPEDMPQRVIHKIIEQLGVDTIRKLLWSIIIDELGKNLNIFYEKYKPSQTLFHKKEDWEKLFSEPIKSNPLEFLRKFKELRGNIERLQDDCREIIKRKVVSDDVLAERYLDLIFPEKKGELSWDILAGYISRRDIQRKEVKFLNSIVKILRGNGYNMLYVFIDEFEDISKLSGTKLTNYVITLNTLINNERHWAVIVSLTQDALDIIRETFVPLYDRLVPYIIRLEPLNEDRAKALIVNYLNLAREKKSKDIFPFSEELIKKMVNITKGNYRSFIKLAHKIIEIALTENLFAPFKEEILERVYGEEDDPRQSL